MKKSTCWTYFSLLLWKNFLIKTRHKKEFFIEILVPAIFCCLLLVVRYLIVAEKIEQPTVYKPCVINNLNILKSKIPKDAVKLWEIDYTPKNDITESIVQDAANSLKLKIRGFDNEDDLQMFMVTNETLVGVVFDAELKSMTSYPSNLRYGLRFPGALRTAKKFSESLTWLTKNLFPQRHEVGPRNKDDNDGGVPPGYIQEGFIAIQNAISLSYIQHVAKKNFGKSDVNIPEIVLQRYPYPPYIDDPLLVALESMGAVIILLSFVYPCTQSVKYVTNEKETQLKEAMKIMGLSTSLHWLAWFYTLWVSLVLTVGLIVLIIKVPWFQGFSAAVLSHSDWSVLLIFLIIYSIATITFCFMISSFFAKANVAGAVGGLVWFISYIPYSFSINNFVEIPLSSKLGLSVFLNTAMPFGFKIILNWESVNIGAQWDNLFNTVTIEDNLSLGNVMIMMIVDALIYMLITLYVEKVMPGGYGMRYKWYFPLTRDFWFPRRIDYIHDGSGELPNPDKFEPEVESSNIVGIRLLNLTKQFGSKIAVKSLSINMYEDQITVLLGHNGAGKTTSISMITGLIPPTSGTAIINGTDILQDLSRVRQSLGFCPQHNILFDELTVKEHIIFYSRLKGLSNDQVDAEIAKYLKILNFEDKRDSQSKTLSGGQKRKLSVGVALCGRSKVVLLDEPSSGMDPAARRDLWDLLQAEKKGRTILLTTHFMDEADVLGDRIAIMSSGRLKCSGTPFFLKKRFGTGYQLICSKRRQCETAKVTTLLQKYIPEIEVKNDVGTELSYQLPEKFAYIFEEMLKELEDLQDTLDLNGYGISMTTLEDVFMKTGSELSNELALDSGDITESSSGASSDIYNGMDSNVIVEPDTQNLHIVRGVKRIDYQWRAMFLKKIYYFMRNWYMFMIQLLIPLFFIVLSVYISKSILSNSELPSLPISLNSYGDTTTLLRSTEIDNTIGSQIAQSYKNMFQSFDKDHRLKLANMSINEEIIALEEASLFTVDTRYMVAATIASSQIIGWFNNEALHTAPLALNLIYNAIARTVLGTQYSIEVINEPLPYSIQFQILLLKNTGGLGFQLALNMSFAMSFVSAIFVMFLIKERESRAKLLQFVSGVRVMIFWTVHLIWDFFIYIVVSTFIVLLMFIFQQEGFSTGNDLARIFLIFMVYGFSTLPFTYLVSFLYNDAATGLSRLSIFNVFTGNALYLVVFVLNLPAFDLTNTAKILQQVFMIFPNFSLAQALANQASLATTRNICETASEAMKVPMELICATVMPECCKLEPFGWENPGIGMILVYMSAIGALYFLILLLVEYLSTSIFRGMLTRSCRPILPLPSEDGFIDDDVQKEKNTVEAMKRNEIKNHNLITRDMTKFYGNFLAVNQISLAIESGECFGLLGVNGAGKTTAFKMLTGDENLTYGDIWVKGYNNKTSTSIIYEMIGYCPQFDALLQDLTGTETLRIFSLLRGVPVGMINSLIERLSKDLAFEKHLNKKILEYSGGNRRKLSTAVALLGNPCVIYLDEPTTGIDPASRRKLWDMICCVRDLGKGIVLTSHSMEECEALCTRIAIMVNGEFKCLGSTQHLKNKFSQGISLSIKLRKTEEVDEYYDGNDNSTTHYRSASLDLNSLELNLDKFGKRVYKFINKHFEGAILQDCHKNLLTFNVPSNIMPYSRIFGLMEANKRGLHIEDYSLSQATLEQVFLKFAQKQRNDEENKKNKKKK